MRVLVTGATGLVGSHLVDRLIETGHPVRAVVRQPEAAERLRRQGADARVGDLAGEVDLTAAVDGMDAVVHCAGFVQVAATRDAVWKVNVEATERLSAASVRAGLGRFVHLSSVAVYGPAPPPIREDGPKRPTAPYGQSKWVAEEALWHSHREHGLPVVALRPCAIYGPRDRHAWPALSRLCRLPVVPLPGGGARLLDLVFVSDVVDAALAALTVPAVVGRAYNITDGEAHTYRDILIAYGQVAGRRPAIVPVPGSALALAAGAASRLMRLLGVPEERAAQVGRLGALDIDIHFAIEAARRDLAYVPRVGLTEGLRRTLAAERQGARP